MGLVVTTPNNKSAKTLDRIPKRETIISPKQKAPNIIPSNNHHPFEIKQEYVQCPRMSAPLPGVPNVEQTTAVRARVC